MNDVGGGLLGGKAFISVYFVIPAKAGILEPRSSWR